MITLPKRQAPAPTPKPESAPTPKVETQVTVDNSEVAEMVAQQNRHLTQLHSAINALATKMEREAEITVTVTEWTNTGRIKTVKITKR